MSTIGKHVLTHLPGRLADPRATLEHDRRADPRIIAAVAAVGGFAPGLASPAADASYEDCLAYCAAFEAASELGHEAQEASRPAYEHVSTGSERIEGVDGNDIELFVHRPQNSAEPQPCIVHIHGGGMVLMSATDPNFRRWRDALADQGLVAIGVEFRNGGGKLGNHPFPAGLEDCASAVKWVHAHRAELGISSIVVSGESGGGNLSLATALKARREGWLDAIDGVYASCPYICGDYANPPEHLLSLRENNGYMLDTTQMAALAKVYDPTGEQQGNPLAWPYHAGPEDLNGLPPHVISVNELDPLRDEGLAYYRKLLGAGVSAVGRTMHGTPHAGDLVFPDITPEIYRDTLHAVRAFAESLQA